jgi:microcystin degradation protein MlrC
MSNRREFLKRALAAGFVIGSGTLRASDRRRVFVAGFSHETNTFHPVKTTSFGFAEVSRNPLPVWKDAGLTVVPGIHAHPNGGGTIEEKPCREAMNRVLDSLRAALPVDAVFLRLHGAMYAEGIGPAETVLVGEVRSLVGPKIPIACTFDLHGNIPMRLAQFGDILVGLKTAPHTDGAQTAELAGRILLDTLAGKVHPVSYVLPIPIMLQGEKAMTTSEPFRSLVEEARRLEREGVPGQEAKILAATIFVGCAWTDSPDTGMSVMITADASQAAARAAAVHLARKIWDARHQFAYGCETAELEEGVTRALAAKETTVFLTDSGDNVTASTPGDLPIVLRHLVERKVESAIVAGLNDAPAVNRCFEAGEGAQLSLSIGATVEKRFGPPLEAEVQVLRLIKNPRLAVVRIGDVEAILAAGPMAFVDPGQFASCGIDPLSRKIVVVKEGYLYPGLTRIAPRYIMLLTPGAGDMRIDRLSYTRRRKPLFPFEPNTTPAAPVRVGLRSPKHLGPLTPAPRPRPEGALRFRAAGLRGGVSEIWSPVAGLAYPSGKNNFVRTRARVTRTRNGRYVEEYCLFVSAPFLRTFSVTS